MYSWKNVWISTVAASLLTGLLYFLAYTIPALNHVNLKGRDIFFRLQHHWTPVPSEAKEIVLVGVDDETLTHLETRWPYPRSFYAEALKNLRPYQPKAVGFDLIFSGQDFSPGSDQAFSKALQEAGNVVIAAHQNVTGEVGPAQSIRDSAWRVGVVDKPRDRDRVLRRGYLTFPGAAEGVGHSWELELYTTAFSEEAAQAIPRNVSSAINYKVRYDEFPNISFWRLIEGRVEANEVRGKIVLIGLTSEAFHDIHATPLGSMPGLAINANMLLMMMTGGFFTLAPGWVTVALTFLSFWVILIAATTSSAVGLLLLTGLLAVFYLVASGILFFSQVILDLWLLVLGMSVILAGSLVYREWQLFVENMRLREESARDPLTGFYSRRFLELKLRSEVKHLAQRRGGPHRVKEVSVVMLDLDNFKLVNDSFGHAEGDRVLKTMAESIRASVRKNELICRFGGDEFCVILPNAKIDDAARFGEKIRELIAANPDLSYRTKGGIDTIRVTTSIGVASVTGIHATDPGKLMKAADRALYRAKAGGRNQVCVFDPERDVLE